MSDEVYYCGHCRRQQDPLKVNDARAADGEPYLGTHLAKAKMTPARNGSLLMAETSSVY